MGTKRGPGLRSKGAGSGSLSRGRSGILTLFLCYRTTDAGRPDFELFLRDLGGWAFAEGEDLTAGEVQEVLLRFAIAYRATAFGYLLWTNAQVDICTFTQIAEVGCELFLIRCRQGQAQFELSNGQNHPKGLQPRSEQ